MKKKMFHIVSSAMTVALLLTAAVPFSAFAGETEAEVNEEKGKFKFITAMSDTERTDVINSVIEKLQQKYPNVEFINDSGEDYNNKIKLAFSSGDEYQLIYTDDLGIAPLVESGYLLEISDYIKKYNWVDRQADGVTDFYNTRTPGEEYSVGMNQAPIVVYYNKDIFDELGVEIPKTLSEYEDILKKATEAGYIGSENCKDTVSGWYIQSIVQNQAPFDDILDWYYRRDSKDSVKEAFIKAEDTVKAWSDAGYFRDQYEGIDYGDVPTLFAQGKTAMSLDGNWFLYNYEQSGLNVGVFPFPAWSNEDDPHYIINPADAAFAIGKNSSDLQVSVAVDFINEMLTPETAEQWLAIGSIPTVKDGVDTSTATPLTQELIASIDGTQPGFYLDNVKSGFLEKFQAEMQLFLSGDQSSDDMWSHLDEFWHEDSAE